MYFKVLLNSLMPEESKMMGYCFTVKVPGSGALYIPETGELLYKLCKVKCKFFPGVCLELVLDGALHALSWQGAPTFKRRMARG